MYIIWIVVLLRPRIAYGFWYLYYYIVKSTTTTPSEIYRIMNFSSSTCRTTIVSKEISTCSKTSTLTNDYQNPYVIPDLRRTPIHIVMFHLRQNLMHSSSLEDILWYCIDVFQLLCFILYKKTKLTFEQMHLLTFRHLFNSSGCVIHHEFLFM